MLPRNLGNKARETFNEMHSRLEPQPFLEVRKHELSSENRPTNRAIPGPHFVDAQFVSFGYSNRVKSLLFKVLFIEKTLANLFCLSRAFEFSEILPHSTTALVGILRKPPTLRLTTSCRSTTKSKPQLDFWIVQERKRQCHRHLPIGYIRTMNTAA